MENKTKKRLRSKGCEVYQRYFFNSDGIIEYVLGQLQNGEPIDENRCEVVFDLPLSYREQIYELIMYYPKKLKEYKVVNDSIITLLYSEYGECIDIMKETKVRTGKANARGKICQNAQDRSGKRLTICELTSEDIKLVRTCPYLGITLNYGSDAATNQSASLDKINPSQGYIRGNIQIISNLANKMKSDATIEQLLMFSKSILKLYENPA